MNARAWVGPNPSSSTFASPSTGSKAARSAAVGDYFEVTESSRLRIPEGRHFCMFAIAAALPLLAAKQRQLDPGDWLEVDALVACPDPDERLVMRIERTGRRRIPTEELT